MILYYYDIFDYFRDRRKETCRNKATAVDRPHVAYQRYKLLAGVGERMQRESDMVEILVVPHYLTYYR